jgi:hypothetical protein
MVGETMVWMQIGISSGSAALAPAAVATRGNTEIRRYRCRTCGATVRPGAAVCASCMHAVDETRAYAARIRAEHTVVRTPPPVADDTVEDTAVEAASSVEDRWLAMIAAVELANRSAAELAWESMAADEDTGVWSPYEEERVASPFEPTQVEHSIDRDTVRHAAVPLRLTDSFREPEASPITTSRMPPSRAALLLRLAPNGFAGSGTPIAAAVVPRGQILDVGRTCAGPWAGDAYLDDHHVQLLTDHGGLRVIDQGSRGGVWLRFEGARWLRDGDWFRIGEQFLCYDAPAEDERSGGRISLIDEEERFGPAIEITGVTALGRCADVVLLHDPYVSGEHCRIVPQAGGVLLEDLDSSNGTWIRLRSGDLIPFGSVVALGRSLYRVEPAEGPTHD